MKIHGLNKITLLDYPGKIACTIFTGSCNFRCPFCHNSALVIDPSSQPVIPEEEIFSFLEARKGRLEGVAITGGEPLISEDIIEFARKIKSMGYSLKIDTNGSFPDRLQRILDEHLADYIAMDVKASIENYPKLIGTDSIDLEKIRRSVDIIMNSDIDYEFRTTAVKSLHTMEDFEAIGKWLSGCRNYYIQTFEDHGTTIEKNLVGYTKEEEEAIAKLMKNYISSVEIRGV